MMESTVQHLHNNDMYIYHGGIDQNGSYNTQILDSHKFPLFITESFTMASRALLITGATGKQGGSVVNALLKANAPFEILALTRNAQSASAQRLLQKSPKIKLVTGDFSNIHDIFRQAKAATDAPIWGVFSVQV
jgi:hypothetical protein